MKEDKPVTQIDMTEASSRYHHIDEMKTEELLLNINKEDEQVAQAVKTVIPKLTQLVDEIVVRMKRGGRVFYIGAGTSGRLGILDASEIPPTYGVDPGVFIGLIAGGDQAIRTAIEGAEDDLQQCFKDLQAYHLTVDDVVVGIAASGRTPYVLGGLQAANQHGMLTACITCNSNSPLCLQAAMPLVVEVGPEFVTGSTRMKAGTAQKLVLNMLSTAVMIRLGKVKGNKMVDMKLANKKLVRRGVRMIREELPKISEEMAEDLLMKYGSVRNAIDAGRRFGGTYTNDHRRR